MPAALNPSGSVDENQKRDVRGEVPYLDSISLRTWSWLFSPLAMDRPPAMKTPLGITFAQFVTLLLGFEPDAPATSVRPNGVNPSGESDENQKRVVEMEAPYLDSTSLRT